jgi:hypothetical protein
VVKFMGSGWLRWLLKQGGVIHVHPNQKDKRCALEFFSVRHDIVHPSKDPRSLLTSGREKDQYREAWIVNNTVFVF